MKHRKLKNLVLFLLVFSACLQTGRLWLGDSAGRAFFYFWDGVFSAKSEEPESSIIAPARLAAGSGNKRFRVLSQGDDTTALESLANALLGEFVQTGAFAAEGPADWGSYLEGRVLVLEFPFAVSAREYLKGFAGRGQAIAERVDSFDTLVLLPARNTEGENRLVFLSGSQAVSFTTAGSTAGTALYRGLESSYTAGGLSYISAQQNGLYLFPDSVFLPQWQTESWTYAPLEKVNPFVADAGGDMTEPLRGFFPNVGAATRHLDPDTGAVVVSDSDRVAKYYPAGVLEYYNYEAAKGSRQTLASAYTTAVAFLAGKDASLSGNYALADVQLKSDGLTFYFDYTVNGLPLYLSDELSENLGLTHALEVVVQDNVVRKYKKLAYYFSVSADETDTVETDFLWALDQTMAGLSADETMTQVENIRLGYLAGAENRCYLKWFVQVDGQPVLQSIKLPGDSVGTGGEG